ncbi:MAG: AAA family ATPase [Methanomicrobiales archaeon]|nr:AAA family ATPase [Methanomicrobiales archaeon]
MTHSPLLRSDETLFRDPEVFELTYLPDHLHHRDAQTRELAFLIRPALRGASVGSAVLRGPPGTGKTTTVRRIFREVREATKRVVPVYVNCRHDRTALAVYRSIFAQVCGCPAPSAGRYLDEIKQGIATRLHDENAALVVCLDDADELIPAGTYNTLLYQLLRLYEKWDVRKAGVFAVTSDLALNLYAEADPSVRSVFHPAEVTFWPYTKTEVREILADRVRQGLYPRVISKVLLDRIATIAAAEQDIRVGIDLLRGAVIRAEKDGRRRVGPEDVTAAARAITTPSLLNRAAELSAGERELACWIAERSRDGGDMASGAVFEAAQDYQGRTASHEHLNALAKAGIVDLAPGIGRGRAIRLRYDPEDIFAVCNARTKPAKTRT